MMDKERIAELERSNAELRAAVILARRPLNIGFALPTRKRPEHPYCLAAFAVHSFDHLPQLAADTFLNLLCVLPYLPRSLLSPMLSDLLFNV
jgi:hypothetical protein